MKKLPLLVLPRKTRTQDWGAEQILLAQQNTKQLVWLYARKEWQGRCKGYTHQPAELQLREPDQLCERVQRSHCLHEGGRLSLRLLQSYAKTIDAFFGCEVTKHLSTKHTLILEN